MLQPFEFLENFRFSILSISIYHRPQSYTWVKHLWSFELPRAFVFTFERLDTLLAWIRHPSENLWPFKFLESIRCSILSVSIIIGLSHTPKSKVMAILFFLSFLVQIQVSRYMMALNHTHESKVMAVSICLALLCLILSVLIYYAFELDVQVKSYDHLSYSRASIVHFRASRYIIGLNHTPESKVMVISICREIFCSILIV